VRQVQGHQQKNFQGGQIRPKNSTIIKPFPRGEGQQKKRPLPTISIPCMKFWRGEAVAKSQLRQEEGKEAK